MECVTKNDAQGQAIKKQPNIIGNDEEQEERKGAAADFRQFMPTNTARPAQNTILPVDVFMRKVQSKQNLLYVMAIKGKLIFPHFRLLIILRHFLIRSNLPP